MTRLFSDMDVAHKRMLRDPVAFTDAIAGAIGKAERGAHRHKHQGIAMCVGIVRAVRKDFALFEELRSAVCLKNNKKIQKATEKNFKKHVPAAVAVRSFHDTEATENRMSVYGYVTSYFVKKDIPVPRIADKIKAMKGIDGVYERLKKEREARELLEEDESDASERLDEEDVEESEEQDDDEQDEAASQRGTPPKASAKRLTVKQIFANYLLVKMPTEKALDRYRSGPFSEDERRGLEIAYDGKGPQGLHEWAFVSELEMDDPDAPEEDNDNEADDQEEDAA